VAKERPSPAAARRRLHLGAIATLDVGGIGQYR
jgi:hypothetical protein